MTPLQMKIVAMEARHMERVVEVARESERRRRARNSARCRKSYARKSPDEKLELSRRHKARMRELHGDGYFYDLNKTWRGTERGKASVDRYNGSEKHRECQRRYRARMKERDREGYSALERARVARGRRKLKVEALWLLVEGIGNIFVQDPLHVDGK